MADNICSFYTQSLKRCSYKISNREHKVCKVHLNTILKHGLHDALIDQISYRNQTLRYQELLNLENQLRDTIHDDNARRLEYHERAADIWKKYRETVERETHIENERHRRNPPGEEERERRRRQILEREERRERRQEENRLRRINRTIRGILHNLQSIGIEMTPELTNTITQRVGNLPDLAVLNDLNIIAEYIPSPASLGEGPNVDEMRQNTINIVCNIIEFRRLVNFGVLDDAAEDIIYDRLFVRRQSVEDTIVVIAHHYAPPPFPVAQDVEAPIDNGGRLARFAQDKQNIHTTAAVQHTKNMVEKILKIEVPKEYQWNKKVCSLTPGEIIIHCKLNPEGAMQMQMKYCKGDNIYEMGKGIYGKVLDSVWQFIKGSDDKECLYKILKTELEDNIGMCEQGNLTRLCNILSGYVDGIAPPESVNEKLGRLFADLAKDDKNSDEKKKELGIEILKENKVLESEWSVWLDAL